MPASDVADKPVGQLTRDELEAEDNRLAKERTRIRERQVEVSRRLDAYRDLDRLAIDPDRLQEIARTARIEARASTDSEKPDA